MIMKKTLVVLAVASLAGCATRAKIDVPDTAQWKSPTLAGKTFAFDIYYSQPTPGVFSGGDAQPLLPLNQVQTSVASADIVKQLPNYLAKKLPANAKAADGTTSDYVLRVELVAPHKRGPAYSDYQAGQSMAMNLITLGLAPSYYNLVAEFDAKYVLTSQGQSIYEKSYKVKDLVADQRGDFDGFSILNQHTAELFQKHLFTTLDDFYSGAFANK